MSNSSTIKDLKFKYRGDEVMVSVNLSQEQINRIAKGVYSILTDSVVSKPSIKNISEGNSSLENEVFENEYYKSNFNS